MAFWNKKTDTAAPLACSFCGKTQQQVKQLVAGPTVYICDECIALSADIVAERSGPPLEPPPPPPGPSSLRGVLSERLDGHPEAVRVLAQVVGSAAAAEAPPPVILLVGAGGVGKTTVCEALVAACGVPAAHAHVHRMTATGYIGADLENVVQQVVVAAGDTPERAERGLLVLEDLHHLALRGAVDAVSLDVGGRDVQPHIARLLDRRVLHLPDDATRRIHPHAPLQAFDPRHLVVVLTCRLDDPPATEPELRAALHALGILQELLDRVDLVLPLWLPDEAARVRLITERMVPRARAATGAELRLEDATVDALARAAEQPGGLWNVRQALVRRALQA